MTNYTFVFFLFCIGTTLLGTTTEHVNVYRIVISPEWNETTFQVEIVRNIRDRPLYHFLEIGIVESPKMALVDMIDGIDMDAVFPQQRNETNVVAKTPLFQFYGLRSSGVSTKDIIVFCSNNFSKLLHFTSDQFRSKGLAAALLISSCMGCLFVYWGIKSMIRMARYVQNICVRIAMLVPAMILFGLLMQEPTLLVVVIGCIVGKVLFQKAVQYARRLRLKFEISVQRLRTNVITSSVALALIRMARYVQYICVSIAMLVPAMILFGLLMQEPTLLLVVVIGGIVAVSENRAIY